MERGFSTLLLVAALALAMSSCLAQPNETTTEPPSPPERVRNQTFVVKDVTNSSRVCLRMTAAIVVNITYYVNETMKNVSTVIPLTDSAQVNQSSRCNASATTASLYVVPMPGDDDFDIPLYILFTFIGDNSTGNQHWEWSNISFGVETAFLDGHSGKPAIAEFMTDAALHGDANDKIEFERSYKCSSNQSISFPKGDNISAFIYVTELQVQAFKFKNVTSGEFDNARTCILDSSGKANKIVPIAVGAALAGLVVVVLIAYLIGRLRSRRQSSYEALS